MKLHGNFEVGFNKYTDETVKKLDKKFMVKRFNK